MSEDKLKAIRMMKKADDLRNNAKTSAAIELYAKAQRDFEKLGEDRLVAECLQMIGVCYKIADDHRNAIKTYTQAIKVFRRIKDRVGEGNTLRDIGTSYTYLHQYNEALGWFKRSVRVLSKTDNKTAIGVTKIKIGLTHTKRKDFSKAKRNLNKGLSLIQHAEKHNWFMEMTAYLNYAEYDFAQHNYNDTLLKLWAAYGLISKHKSLNSQKRRVAQILGLLAHGYWKLGNEKLGLKYLDQALSILKTFEEKARAIVFADFDAPKLFAMIKSKDMDHYQRLQKKHLH